MDNFIKDGYISFLEDEVLGEEDRVQYYRDLKLELIEEAVEEQRRCAGFEKEFI